MVCFPKSICALLHTQNNGLSKLHTFPNCQTDRPFVKVLHRDNLELSISRVDIANQTICFCSTVVWIPNVDT